jgi:hypothetical protein
MAKSVLLWYLWLASTTKTLASSPPGFETLAGRLIDRGDDEYLYEWSNVMERSAISNTMQSSECRRARGHRATTNRLTLADPTQYLPDRHSATNWTMDGRHRRSTPSGTSNERAESQLHACNLHWSQPLWRFEKHRSKLGKLPIKSTAAC